MRVLFINPPLRRLVGQDCAYYPVGLAYLAAVTRGLGHTVGIYDVENARGLKIEADYRNEREQWQYYGNIINDSDHPLWQEVLDNINEFEPDIVGIRAQTITYASALKIAELAKRSHHGCPVVAGGPHPSIRPEEVLSDENVDFVIREEGETSFAALIKALNSKNPDFSSVPGLSYRLNETIVHNQAGEFIEDLDTIPHPARELLLNSEGYGAENLGVLMASRGCPFSCSFCFNMWKRTSRYRSPENVIEELVAVRERYGTNRFSFKDDTFTVNKKWVSEFCDGLLSRGLNVNWDCTTRADCLDDGILALMKRAGCDNIKIGVESGSERILKAIQKGESLEQIREGTRLLKKHGIFFMTYFITGLPQESEEDMTMTYDFMREINPPFAAIGLYKAYPCTALFEQGVQAGVLRTGMTREDYFKINPIDYYYIDTNKRSVVLDSDRFNYITQKIMNAFVAHNTGLYNSVRRAYANRRLYLNNPIMLKNAFKRFLKVQNHS